MRAEVRAGFSLVELLTVVGIIGMLAGLLLPGLKGARDQARGVACLSNLRQMVVAAGVYVENNDERFPVAYWADHGTPGKAVALSWDFTTVRDWSAGGTVSFESGLLWASSVRSEIQQCPVFRGASNGVIQGVQEPHTGYNYNTSFIGHGQWEAVQAPVRAAMVRRPAWCALFGDGQYSEGANKYMRSPFPHVEDAFPYRARGTQGYRHRGKTNVAFVDGHAEAWRERNANTLPGEVNEVAKGTGFLSVDNELYDLE